MNFHLPKDHTSPRARRKWHRLVAWVGATLGLGAGLWWAVGLVPLPHELSEPPGPGWEFVDRRGVTLRELRDEREQFHRPAAEGEIPPVLIAATLAAEDQRFWNHPGVDWRATLRAAGQMVRHRRIVSGASTLTQQLVKLAEPRPRTFLTKLKEAAQALRLEREWSKPRILAAYLNRVDYGNLQRGCNAAAHHYFGKPPAELSPAEAALLAGLPQAPSRLNPRARPSLAQRRQQWILGRMHALGWLTTEEWSRARTEPLQLASARREFAAPHFVDLVLEQGLPPAGPPRRVRTTLDLELNRFVEQTLDVQLTRLRAQEVRQGSVVVLDNRTGYVLALVGSGDYFAPADGQVNGARAPRSAGSTLKPFTYALAFERGWTPASVVADVPCEFPNPTGGFRPVNYDRHHLGPVRLRMALANSLNVPAVKMLDALGGAATLHARLTDCGLTTLTRAAEFYGLGLTLGNAEVRLLELANAYACLARLGEWRPYRLCQDETNGTTPKRVFAPEAAWQIADVLADNHARALAFGLETPLRFDFPVACKTGTSTDYRDNWAVGYTPEFTVAVWVGNFDGSPMRGVSGVTGAGPVLQQVFQHLRSRFGTTWYQSPPGWIACGVHPLTGKRLTTTAANRTLNSLQLVIEWFPADRLPPAHSANDFDAEGRLQLPAEYRTWLASGDNWLGNRAVPAEREPPSTVRVLHPLPGTIFYLDPDLPASARRIDLQAAGSLDCRWQSQSLECSLVNGRFGAQLTAGRHQLSVRDPNTGAVAETWIEVRRL